MGRLNAWLLSSLGQRAPHPHALQQAVLSLHTPVVHLVHLDVPRTHSVPRSVREVRAPPLLVGRLIVSMLRSGLENPSARLPPATLWLLPRLFAVLNPPAPAALPAVPAAPHLPLPAATDTDQPVPPRAADGEASVWASLRLGEYAPIALDAEDDDAPVADALEAGSTLVRWDSDAEGDEQLLPLLDSLSAQPEARSGSPEPAGPMAGLAVVARPAA